MMNANSSLASQSIGSPATKPNAFDNLGAAIERSGMLGVQIVELVDRLCGPDNSPAADVYDQVAAGSFTAGGLIGDMQRMTLSIDMNSDQISRALKRIHAVLS